VHAAMPVQAAPAPPQPSRIYQAAVRPSMTSPATSPVRLASQRPSFVEASLQGSGVAAALAMSRASTANLLHLTKQSVDADLRGDVEGRGTTMHGHPRPGSRPAPRPMPPSMNPLPTVSVDGVSHRHHGNPYLATPSMLAVGPVRASSALAEAAAAVHKATAASAAHRYYPAQRGGAGGAEARAAATDAVSCGSSTVGTGSVHTVGTDPMRPFAPPAAQELPREPHMASSLPRSVSSANPHGSPFIPAGLLGTSASALTESGRASGGLDSSMHASHLVGVGATGTQQSRQGRMWVDVGAAVPSAVRSPGFVS